MLDNIKVFSPAKINIFLRILGKRADGLHNIRSGITFVDLFDEIEIKQSDKLNISYTGYFKPSNESYDDCIILKTLKFLSLEKTLTIDVKIKKNIPVQGGLGSASTNAAGFLQGLHKMKIININDYKNYDFLGADIPSFLFKKNCLVVGIGGILYPQTYPKYYFLLVKPNFNNSTKDMYNKLESKVIEDNKNFYLDEFKINEEDSGNDFEQIVKKEREDFREIFDFLGNLEKGIFTRMSGSGSCCYTVFEKKEYALKAYKVFKSNFKDLWSHVCENNIINNMNDL